MLKSMFLCVVACLSTATGCITVRSSDFGAFPFLEKSRDLEPVARAEVVNIDGEVIGMSICDITFFDDRPQLVVTVRNNGNAPTPTSLAKVLFPPPGTSFDSFHTIPPIDGFDEVKLDPIPVPIKCRETGCLICIHVITYFTEIDGGLNNLICSHCEADDFVP